MLGLVTIGQAPRDDITASMFGTVTDVDIREFGALDGLDESQIRSLKPEPGDSLLVSKLVNGAEVELGKTAITPLLQGAVDSALDAGASAVCILCTGKFENVKAPVPVLFPDRILTGAVDALLPDGVLGVLLPHEGQRRLMLDKWSRPTRRVVVTAVSPYSGSASFVDAGRALRNQGVDLILMDCMGFTREMERQVRDEAPGTPVILSNGLVGSILVETWGLRRTHDESLAV